MPSGSDVLVHGQQLLEPGIVADRVPHWIDLQARDGDGLAGWHREKFFEILHRFRGSTGLRLNLGQSSQVPGTKYRVFLGRQQLECLLRDVDRITLAVKGNVNPT